MLQSQVKAGCMMLLAQGAWALVVAGCVLGSGCSKGEVGHSAATAKISA
jgi:hypothetical protein